MNYIKKAALLKFYHTQYLPTIENELLSREIFKSCMNKTTSLETKFNEIRQTFASNRILYQLSRLDEIEEKKNLSFWARTFTHMPSLETLEEFAYATFRKEVMSDISSYIGSYTEWLIEFYYYIKKDGNNIEEKIKLFESKQEIMFKESKYFFKELKRDDILPFKVYPEFVFHVFARHFGEIQDTLHLAVNEKDSASKFPSNFSGKDLANLLNRLLPKINVNIDLKPENNKPYVIHIYEKNKDGEYIYCLVIKSDFSYKYELHTIYPKKINEKTKPLVINPKEII